MNKGESFHSLLFIFLLFFKLRKYIILIFFNHPMKTKVWAFYRKGYKYPHGVFRVIMTSLPQAVSWFKIVQSSIQLIGFLSFSVNILWNRKKFKWPVETVRETSDSTLWTKWRRFAFKKVPPNPKHNSTIFEIKILKIYVLRIFLVNVYGFE